MRISDWSSDVCSSDLDPFTRVVNVTAGGQIHDGICAPADRPDHFVDFGSHIGRDGAVADIGVYLHQEIAPDRHGFGFRVVDVVGDDGTAACDFIPDEFRSEEHTSELQSLMRISYAVFCLKKKKRYTTK